LKLAFTTWGNTLEASVDSRFGRAEKFLIYDLEEDVFKVIDNQQNLNAAQGAGIQAAETIARLGVDALVTGHCGPKAFRVLSAAGIKVYYADGLTINMALAAFNNGTLSLAESADVEDHWR